MSFLERSRRAHNGESIDDEDAEDAHRGAEEEEREPIEDPGDSPSAAGPSSGGGRGLSLRLGISEGPSESTGLSGSGWRRK